MLLALALMLCAGASDDVYFRETGGTEWRYEDVGTWPLRDPHCGGQRQSPIDFPTTLTSFTPPPLVFHNYGLINTSLENNGHNLNVRLPSDLSLDQRPRVSGGGLPADYLLDAFHFHWGAVSQRGSEHLLDGCAFAGEMHLVHVKEEYGNVGEALKHEDGLAVVGVWLTKDTRPTHTDGSNSEETDDTVAEDSAPISDPHRWLSSLTPTSSTTQHAHTLVNLRQLLPGDVDTFYRYEGSLTTPPCTENVLWTVLETPVVAPAKFLQGLRGLVAPRDTTHEDNTHQEGSDGVSLSDNFRPTQPLGSRTVYYSGDLAEHAITCSARDAKDDDDDHGDREKKKADEEVCLEFPPVVMVEAEAKDGGQTVVEMEETVLEGEETVGEGGECLLESPLDLHLRHTQVVAAPRLAWRRLSDCRSVNVVNDGHVLRVRYPSLAPEWELVGGNLTGRHYLGEIVLRWGSEHHLAGFSFPLELQLVHYNAKYHSLQEALSRPDGVVVVAKLFQEPVGIRGSLEWLEEEGGGDNHYLHSIINAIRHERYGQVQDAGSHATVRSPDVPGLMGSASSYYEYRGTLPGGPCNAPATWIVLRKVGEVSQEQVAALRTLRDPTNATISANPRPVHYTSRTITLRVNSPPLAQEFMSILSLTKQESGEEPDQITQYPAIEEPEPQGVRASRFGTRVSSRSQVRGSGARAYGNGGTTATPPHKYFSLVLILVLGGGFFLECIYCNM